MSQVEWKNYHLLLEQTDEEDRMAREEAMDDALQNLIDGLKTDPAYQDDSEINGETVPMVIVMTDSGIAKVKAFPGTNLNIGDMVTFRDEPWICVEKYYDKMGIINAVIWMCNYFINFQNKSNPIHTRFVVVDKGNYSKISGTSDAPTMDNTYKVYITLDPQTKKLFVDKRLAFGPIYNSSIESILEVYEISGLDFISQNYGAGSHLLVMTVQRGVFNDQTDSMDLNLCDVYHDDSSDDPSETGSCLITGKDSIMIGTSRKYTASFFNAKGELVLGAEPVWDVDIPTGQGETTKITYVVGVDGSLTLKTEFDKADIGREVTITLSDAGDVYGEFVKKVRVTTIG